MQMLEVSHPDRVRKSCPNHHYTRQIQEAFQGQELLWSDDIKTKFMTGTFRFFRLSNTDTVEKARPGQATRPEQAVDCTESSVKKDKTHPIPSTSASRSTFPSHLVHQAALVDGQGHLLPSQA